MFQCIGVTLTFDPWPWKAMCHRLVVRSLCPCWNGSHWRYMYGGHILDLTARVPTGVRREEGDEDYWRGCMARDVKRPKPNPPPPSFQPLHLCTMVTFVYRKTSLWHQIRFEIIFYVSLKLIGCERPKVHALLHQYLIYNVFRNTTSPFTIFTVITIEFGLDYFENRRRMFVI